MKESIEWHERGLKNREASLVREREKLKAMTQDIERREQSAAFLRLQIETAKAEGKKAFDRDKYLVKRKVKQDAPKPNGHRDDCICDACLGLRP
jgi:hypothetical protein